MPQPIVARLASMLLLAVSLLSVGGADVALADPLPSGDVAVTYRTYADAVAVPFYRRLLVEGYQNAGMKDAKWDAAAVAFLEKWGVIEARHTLLRPDAHSLAEEGAALVASGCRDPLVVYFVAKALEVKGDKAAAARRFESAAAAMRDSNYAPLLKASALFGASRSGRSLDARDTQEDAMVFLRQAIKDKAYGPGEERIFLNQFLPHVKQTDLAQIKALHTTLVNANAEEWLTELLNGVYRINCAWKARGTGYGHTVSEDNALDFAGHLGEARIHLTRSWELNPDDPHAAVAMISVSMGESAEEELRLWFDRAVAAEFDCMEAYRKLLWAMRPRWHGSHREMYALGVECVKTGRFDTLVPFFYIEVLTDIGRDANSTAFWNTPGVYEFLHQIVEGYLQDPDTSEEQKCYLRSVEAVFCSATQRWDRARVLLDGLGENFDASVADLVNANPEGVVGQVYAFTGPRGKELLHGRELALSGDLEAALEIYEEAATADLGSPAAKQMVLRLAKGLRIFTGFARGESVTLDADPVMEGWHPVVGEWAVSPDGWIVGTSSERGLLLVFNGNFGHDWEIAGQIEFLGGGIKPAGGLAFGWRQGVSPHVFLLQKWSNAVLLQGADPKPIALAAGVNTFRLRCKGGVADAWVNDQAVFVGHQIPPQNGMFALGGIKGDGGSMRFRNITIRKIGDEAGEVE